MAGESADHVVACSVVLAGLWRAVVDIDFTSDSSETSGALAEITADHVSACTAILAWVWRAVVDIDLTRCSRETSGTNASKCVHFFYACAVVSAGTVSACCYNITPLTFIPVGASAVVFLLDTVVSALTLVRTSDVTA